MSLPLGLEINPGIDAMNTTLARMKPRWHPPSLPLNRRPLTMYFDLKMNGV